MISGRFIKKIILGLAVFILTVNLFSVPGQLFAQSNAPSVSVTVDTNEISIGQQIELSIHAAIPGKVSIVWPQLPDTFSTLEVVRKLPVDTLESGTDSLRLRQKYIITGFDSGYHVIPPFPFITTTGDTIETTPLLITVNTPDIDTTRSIREIKGQVQVPYTFMDFVPYIAGILILGLLIYLLIRFIRNRKDKVVVREKPVSVRPAHEIALEQLRLLDEEKVWQQGNYKLYHTRLTDILRTFIEHRWQIYAMEMTTDEILAIRVISSQPQQVYDELYQILRTADLVKFAKLIPVVTDNEQSMRNAIHFVESNMALVSEGKEEKPS